MTDLEFEQLQETWNEYAGHLFDAPLTKEEAEKNLQGIESDGITFPNGLYTVELRLLTCGYIAGARVKAGIPFRDSTKHTEDSGGDNVTSTEN